MSTAATRTAARPAPRPPAGTSRPVGARVAASPRRESSPSRKQSRLAFAVLTATIAAVMVLGLAALQALLAQTSFKIDDLQSRVAQATQANEELTSRVARLASPARIARVAGNLGMTLPAVGIQVLHVPGLPSPSHSKVVAGVRP